MIDFGLHKPLALWACPSASRATNVLTSAWYSLEIPNCQSGVRAKWVVLSIGQAATPGTPEHIYFMPGYSATDDPAAGSEPYCHVLNAFQSPVVLDVAGYSYIHVKAVAISGVQVAVCPVEEDGHGVNHGPLRYPPRVAAAGVNAAPTHAVYAQITIPNTAAGEKPHYVMLTWDVPAANLGVCPMNSAHVRQVILPRYAGPLILDVKGQSILRFFRASGTGTVNVRVTPLENN